MGTTYSLEEYGTFFWKEYLKISGPSTISYALCFENYRIYIIHRQKEILLDIDISHHSSIIHIPFLKELGFSYNE
jgi:hypothetical protein